LVFISSATRVSIGSEAHPTGFSVSLFVSQAL
jgi:hypothetical protein